MCTCEPRRLGVKTIKGPKIRLGGESRLDEISWSCFSHARLVSDISCRADGASGDSLASVRRR